MEHESLGEWAGGLDDESLYELFECKWSCHFSCRTLNRLPVFLLFVLS